MPELPEVETIKNEIIPFVVGRSIQRVELLWEGMVREQSPAEFKLAVIGRRVAAINRRGKYLLFSLDNGRTLVLHLRMTGSLITSPPGQAVVPEYTRAIIGLSDGTTVFFKDLRKFGTMRLVDNADSVTGKLGPEPLDPSLTPAVLRRLLKGRKAPIKAVLCDQEVIAGLGNMYADEVLFAAAITPTRSAGSLSIEETQRVHAAIREVLACAIGNKGASVRDYCRPDGTRGTAHLQFKVAHRRGETCLVCGTALGYVKVRGRGTYFCPKCQRP
jgi:formamidopyrimidine-DNA glycosylase